MKKISGLDAYKEAIVGGLVELFGYTKEEAIFVVNGYASIVDRIGEFENPNQWAAKLDEALESHITPDMWLNVL